MRELHPDRREQPHVHESQHDLHDCQDNDGSLRQPPAAVGRLQRHRRGAEDEHGADRYAQRRVQDAQPQQQRARGREVRLEPVEERRRRVERVAERGDGARLANADHQQQQADQEAEGARPARDRHGRSARQEVRRERQAEQQDSVFARCSGITIARARLSSWATSLNSTSPAPSKRLDDDEDERRPSRPASPDGRPPPSARSRRPARARPPAPGRSRHGARTRSASRVSGARGTTSPLQSGQWAPQPAPEPVART